MERKQALAMAAATTLVLGSTMIAAAATGGVAILGFGGDQHHGLGSFVASYATSTTAPKPRVVTRTHDVYDPYVVDDGSGAGNTGSGTSSGPVVRGNASASGPIGRAESGGATPARTPSTNAPAGSNGGTQTPPPAQPTPTTLVPPGVEIPDNWPAGKPIPPIPPNCREPHLEDNGKWNCQDD